jgi:protein involved in polysaccharide export with SLBB domain
MISSVFANSGKKKEQFHVRHFCAMHRSICLLLGIGLLLPLLVFAQPTDSAKPQAANAEKSSTTAATVPDGESVISPDDTLDIFVMDAPDLTKQYRVSPNGTLAFPLLSAPLKAAGLSTTAFADALAKQLHDEGIVTKANIVVSIASSRAKSVAITGAVRMPQLYTVYGHTTLLDVLSQAQGLSEDASNICVVSRGDTGMQAAGTDERVQTVDLKKLMQSGDPAYNLNIYPCRGYCAERKRRATGESIAACSGESTSARALGRKLLGHA